MRSILSPLVVTLSLAAVLAQTAPRANTCCGLMYGKIYCYGGLVYTSSTENKADNVMNVMDITNSNETSSNDLQNMWKTVSYIADNIDLIPRTDAQCLVINERNRMIINGGHSNPKSADTNIMYNASQNKWYAHSAYSEPRYGERVIYYGSASYVPGKGAAFYGGFETNVKPNYTISYTNASEFLFADGHLSTIGYTQVSYFNIDNVASTWSTPVPLTTATDQFAARQATVFDPVTNLLLVMGGEYRPTNPPSLNAISSPYSYVKAFNTQTNIWSFVNFTGDAPMSGRMYNTLTLLPSTNRHVLLYGGEDGGSVASDYCFVLNLDKKNWTKHTIDAPVGTTLSRSRHSSVAVDNKTLFVMWGIDGNKVGLSSVLILNITNPDDITLSNNYTAARIFNAGDGTSDGDGNGNTAAPVVDNGLSGGAKTGIVVAVVVVAIVGALVAWLYFRNKKKNKEQELEPMEVDWDEIENNYTEIPRNLATTHPNRFVASPLSEGSTTLVNGGDASSPTPAVRPDAIEMHQPHAIDSPQQTSISKPDGGYDRH